MSAKKSILQMIGRLFWFVFFTAIIITGVVLIYEFGPDQYRYTEASFEFDNQFPQGQQAWAAQQNAILDQHSHTTYSDGSMSVEQNILWHLKHGYNVTFITDHGVYGLLNRRDVARMKEKYKDQIIVIQGLEWSNNRIHMNMLGISEWNQDIPSDPTDEEIQAAIEYAHSQNALVTVNHIPWSLRVGMVTHPSRQQLLDWGVDFVEMVNENDYDINSTDWCNDTDGFGMITGTDVHSPNKVFGWTGLNLTEFTEAAVMTELRAKRTSIFYNSTGDIDQSVAFENPWYEPVKPLKYIGEMFEWFYPDGVDWTAVGYLALYLLGVFFFAEILRIGNRKFWARLNARKGTPDK
jgi:hypothetical protein